MNKWRKLIQVVLVGVMLLAVCGAAAPAPAVVVKAQPQLLQLAAAQPAARVSVIVQKADQSDQAEKLVRGLGGAVTLDLHIINAFAAQMPARAVSALAQAPQVRWVSLDAPMVKTAGPDGTVDTANLLNAYNKAIGADKVWAMGYQGSSVTVAVVDSGYASNPDLSWTEKVGFNGNETNTQDRYGHGVHVSGIIGGTGAGSGGQYIGVAPKVNIISVKVSDGDGQGTTSGVVAGLQWVLNNQAAYNIRVVNMSINSAVAEPYHTSPLDAAVEILWFNKIVVVVSAGNNGSGAIYPPANDPFVITVGSMDDRGTAATKDDVLSAFSAYGVTGDGFAKPDLLAPGANIIAPLASNGVALAQAHPANVVSSGYFRMSGTSMAAAVATGAVALLLQDEPGLTPDQVKYRLMNTGSANVNVGGRRIPYLNVYNAVVGTTTASANTGVVASQLLWTGSAPVTWSSVNWNSVNWNSVNWNSVNWNSVNWNSVSWNK